MKWKAPLQRQAARRWARPPFWHSKNQSCFHSGLLLRLAFQALSRIGSLAGEVAASLAAGTFSASQMAVLYRTQRQSKALESALIDAGAPYQVVGGTSFFQRKAVKDLVAYLRLLINPVDEAAFLRIVNVPPRQVRPLPKFEMGGKWTSCA